MLKQLDKSIARFEGARAEVELTAVDAAGAESCTGSGKAYFDRGEAVRLDRSSPDEKTLLSTGPDLHVSARCRNVSKDVPLEDSLFKPKWPKGTETVKR